MKLVNLKDKEITLYFPKVTEDTGAIKAATKAARGKKLYHSQKVTFVRYATIRAVEAPGLPAGLVKREWEELSKATVDKNQFPSSITYEPMKLEGVQKVTVSYSTDIGSAQGLVRNFLQAWYVKPVDISIDGKTYYGAFKRMTVYSAETQVERLRNGYAMDFDNLVVGQILTPEGSQSLSVTLEIKTEDDVLNFKGYIKAFNYTEDIAKPFVYTWSMQFLGLIDKQESLEKGIVSATIDKGKSKKLPIPNIVSSLTDRPSVL